MSRICVLIPCYNEAPTVQNVVRRFAEALPEAEIFVYDNNSTDDTARLAAEAGAMVRRERRQGKGNVVRGMFGAIEADCYILVDGDDTYPAGAAPEMARLVLEEETDMVIGDRLSSTYFTENKRRFHNGGNRLVRRLINTIFRSDVRDILTGYRAFSRKFVKTFPVLSRGFEIETEMTVHALEKNLLVRSIPVDYRDRPDGSASKLNTARDGARVMGTVFNLFKEYKPFAFFSICSFLLLAAGLALFVPVLLEYLRSGLVLRFPTLIVSMFFILASVVSFATGVILDTVNRKYRMTYELLAKLLTGKDR